jgi:hypothetical protein
MTLHNGPIPQKTLDASAQALMRALVGAGGELGYLVIHKSGEYGYLVVVNDIPDSEYRRATLLKQVKDYLGNGKYIEHPLGHEPDGEAGKRLHFNYITLGEADVIKLMPLFAERGKDHIYRTGTESSSKKDILELVDKKAITVDWRNLKEGREKETRSHQAAQLARAIANTDNCVTVLVVDNNHNMEIVHYARRNRSGNGIIKPLADWLQAHDWASSALEPEIKPAHLTLEKKAGQAAGMLSLDRYDRIILPIQHPVAQEELKQLFIDNGLQDHILRLPSLSQEIFPRVQDNLAAHIQHTSRGIA